jgi:hypothetical protein
MLLKGISAPGFERKETPCQCPAMRNGHCRLHGGLSTGAKTPEGIERMKVLGAGAIEEFVKEGVKWLFDEFRKKQEGKRIQGPSDYDGML